MTAAEFMEKPQVADMRDMCLMLTDKSTSVIDAQHELLPYIYAVTMWILFKLKFPLVAADIGVE